MRGEVSKGAGQYSVLSTLLLLLLASGGAQAADDVQDLVFQGAKQPLVIRLHVRIDGKPFRAAHHEAWHDYVAHLFRQLDRDGDGFLSEAEAAQLPPAQAIFRTTSGNRMTVNVAFNFKVVDSNGDGKVSLAELEEYYDQYGGPALQVLQSLPNTTATAQLGDQLFRKLDTNGDGKLSREELAAAPKLLSGSSEEEAEQFSSAHLIPPPARRSPQEVQVPMAGMRRRAALAPRTSFVVPAGDEVTDREPDVELILRLGSRGPGEESLEVVRPRTPRPGLRLTKTTDGSVYLVLDGVLIELRRNEGRPALVEGLRQRLLHQFHGADLDRKGYLTQHEAQRAGFFPEQFALLDHNGDGKLTEQELTAYLDDVQPRQARALTSATAMLISEEGRGLFALLDRNCDGALGLRELRAAAELPALLGRDGELRQEDLPRIYRIGIGLCEASFDRFGGRGVFTPRSTPLLALDWSPPGLAWFHKMDRNHDGDLSPREFLGSREEFDRLDTDGDGLISLEEAMQALARVKKN